MVLELKDKIGVEKGGPAAGPQGDVVEALIALGYSAKEARDAAHAVPKDTETTEDRIREAIKIASRG